MTTFAEGVNDNQNSTTDTLDDATNALLNRWKDAEKPSDTGEGANTEIDDDEDDATIFDEEDDDGADNSEDDSSLPEATDDHRVTLTVDGETKSVTVKELKRLFGQEASLTRKSQEVAAARKAAEADAERYTVATQRLLTKAEDRFKPFENIDWMVAQNRLTPDEFAALRAEARDAYSEVEFLKAEANDFLAQVQGQRAEARVAQAKETIATLEKDIPGWDKDAYEKVRSYAVKSGMEMEAFNNIVDAPSIKIIHEAMRYSEAREKAKAKKANQRTAPKRVLKPSSGISQNLGKPTDKSAESIATLKQTGRRDDAVNALMARWADGDND
jgi:hypothetical protein